VDDERDWLAGGVQTPLTSHKKAALLARAPLRESRK